MIILQKEDEKGEKKQEDRRQKKENQKQNKIASQAAAELQRTKAQNFDSDKAPEEAIK